MGLSYTSALGPVLSQFLYPAESKDWHLALWLMLSHSTKCGLHRCMCTWLSSYPSAYWPGHPSKNLNSALLLVTWPYLRVFSISAVIPTCASIVVYTCLDYCSFVILSETRTLCSQILFYFKLFCPSSLFPCPHIYRITFYICSKNWKSWIFFFF